MPLAIDLYCGLLQAEFRWRANSFVQQLMARRAKHPNHVPLAIGHYAPAPLSLKARFMREFNNARLATGLACGWQIWMLSTHAGDNATVFVRTTRVVDLLDAWILSMKRAALNLGRFGRATIGAIPLIAVRGRDVKVLSANSTIPPRLRFVRLFATSQTALARLATKRAIAFVRALRFESGPAHCAE